MSRIRYVCKWNEKENRVDYLDPNSTISNPHLHYVIDDEMSPTWNPVDDQFYTSKHKFRDVYRKHDMVELGGERPKPREPRKACEKYDFGREVAERYDSVRTMSDYERSQYVKTARLNARDR